MFIISVIGLRQDDFLVAVNKPVGMVVHPAPGNWNGTLVNALAFHLNRQSSSSTQPLVVGISSRQRTPAEGEGDGDGDDGESSQALDEGVEMGWRGEGALRRKVDALRPGIVHRLDKGTSGVLVVAKTPEVGRD